MRRFYHIIGLTLIFVMAMSAFAQAQQQKIGYVNTDLILKNVPEYSGIQQQLGVISEEWEMRLEEMQQEIDQLREDFESKEILYTEETKAQRQQEITQKVQARQQFRNQKFGPQGEYFSRQRELLEPIQRMVYEAVIAVAQRQDIDFVFDRAKNSSLLFSRKQWNLNKDVLQEMGITLNQ
jgi:outer membrane protein